MNIYTVVPYRYFENSKGRRVSPHGAAPSNDFELRQRGFTIKVNHHDGTVTYGVNAVKAGSTEAVAVRGALAVASATNGKYGGVEIE